MQLASLLMALAATLLWNDLGELIPPQRAGIFSAWPRSMTAREPVEIWQQQEHI